MVARRQLPAPAWTAAIALPTVAFALGRAVAPVPAGAISDATGTIAAGFWVAPVLLATAAGVNLLQRSAADPTSRFRDEHSGRPA